MPELFDASELQQDIKRFIREQRAAAEAILLGLVTNEGDSAIHNMANGILRTIVALEANLDAFLDKQLTSEDLED